MKLMLGFIVPFLLVCLPPTFQIIFTSRRLRHQTKLSLFAIFIISLAAGIFSCSLAFRIGTDALTADWPEDKPRCMNGVILPLAISFLIDVVGCVVIGIVGGVMYKRSAPADAV